MRRPNLHYKTMTENDILATYINKNAARNKADMRRIKRSLRKLNRSLRAAH